MTDKADRQYLDDVPRDLQDLIFEDRPKEAISLAMSQKGLGKMKAALEVGRIQMRMKDHFPESMPTKEPDGIGSGLSPKKKTMIMWAFVSIVLLAGILFSFFGVRGLIRANASKDWPTAEGVMIESRVEKDTSGTGSDKSTSYHAEIEYEYTVRGTNYKGDRVAYGDHGRGNSSHAKKIVEKYPTGKTITVYYTDEDPEECLLEPGVRGQTFITGGIGLFLFALGCVFLWVALAVSRDEQKSTGTKK